MAGERYVYRFGAGASSDHVSRELLGNKGSGLVEMTRLSMPVPPGFVISTQACRHYMESGLPAQLETEIHEALRWLEKAMGRDFDDAANPLLVSVRSGAAVSMPGMMDTILNVGLTQSNLAGFAQQARTMTVALDSYRRLIQMFGSVVLGVPRSTSLKTLFTIAPRLSE